MANMLSKMKQNTKLGSRIAEVHNGSSQFTGESPAPLPQSATRYCRSCFRARFG